MFSRLHRGALLLISLMAVIQPAGADDMTALVRVDVARSALAETGGGVELRLDMSQPVPYRVQLMQDPPRVALDFNEVDWTGVDLRALAQDTTSVRALRAGALDPGWSRLVLEMDSPFDVATADLRRDDDTGRAVLTVRLEPISAAMLAERALPALEEADSVASAPQPSEDRLVVVLDPGHGGIDPGAQSDGLTEAELMLTFARELRERLRRAGGFEVVMTRDDDVFVSLEGRIRIARAAGADVFLSLHADALAEGAASGSTVYTFDEDATDAAAAAMAERHERDGLLGGVDLTGQDDAIAKVLMAVARDETAPRTDRLADALIGAIRAQTGHLHRRPRQAGAFSVLKAPDIPSVLLELGFLSSATDRALLVDEAWRAQMAEAVVQALQDWAEAEAVQRAAD